MEISKLQSFWKQKSENDGSKGKPSKVVISNRNSNNSNNKDVSLEESEAIASDMSKNDEMGDIHPETTPEGYGLRTPYGTHLNLDFLKYCQNIADGQTYHVPSLTRRLSSSSLKSSLNTSDSKLSSENSVGSDKEPSSPDQKQIDKNLWETRRRLDAFRSYRKKVPTGVDKQQYLGRFSKMSSDNHANSNGGQSQQSVENQTTEPPVLSNLLNAPIPQQNLQVVREQMAAALTRLKYLESEVKQIQVLQVQISVLKQEKQKLNTELKKYKEGSNTDLYAKESVESITNSTRSISSSTSGSPRTSHVLNSVPPPPPRRRYKSIAVGSDDALSINKEKLKEKSQLSRSSVRIDKYSPSEQTTFKDVCVGISPELLSKKTCTNVIQLCNVNTSSTDLILTKTTSCGDNILMVDAECQYLQLKLENTGTDALPYPTLTERGTQIVAKSFSDRSVGERLMMIDAECQYLMPGLLDTSNEAPSRPISAESYTQTNAISFTDKSVGDHVMMTDADCQYIQVEFENTGSDALPCPVLIQSGTQMDAISFNDIAVETINDIYVLKYLEDYVDKSVGDDVIITEEPTLCDASTCTIVMELKSQATGTVNVMKVDNAIMCKWESADFSCYCCPEMENIATTTETVETEESSTLTDIIMSQTETQSTNTVPVQTSDKLNSCHPDATDFSCNVTIHSGVTVGTATDSVIMEESETNTNIVDCQDSETQFTPTSSDFSCVVNILSNTCDVSVTTDAMPEKPTSDVSVQTVDAVPVDRNDAMTDTNDLQKDETTGNLQSEISTYVGKVEILLEEQQSLLADNYKEFEQVRDENSSTDISPIKFEAKGQNKSLLSKIGVFDVFAKDGYELPSDLILSCRTISDHFTNQGEGSSAALELSMVNLQQEWFSVAALPKSRPDYIKDFVSQVNKISPAVLRLIINSLDATGNSALHYAISHENFGLIYTLSDIDELNPDQYNNAGYTASMLAAITRIENEFEVQAVAALFQRADVSLHAKQAGQTALMLAVSHGCVLAAKLLLKAGADINSQDEDGSTALMCATEHGHIELVKLLLAHPDCDPTITDNDGSAAINIAMESGHRDIGVLLYVQLKLDKPQE